MIMQQELEAKYTLFGSIEEMLAPDTLGIILQRPVSQVTCEPFDDTGGFSGSVLYHVTADDRLLIMKRLFPTRDWILIASDDQQCRSVRLWQYGVLDRLRPHLEHARLAACQERDEYAILMEDVSRGLFPFGQEVPELSIHRLLDALAAMHAMFWEDDDLRDPNLGLCNIKEELTCCWPVQFERYRTYNPQTVDLLTRGWAALFDMLEPDVRDIVQSLMNNLTPVLDILAQYPSTLIHGDYRTGNLALLPETDQVVAFDWQAAGYAPALIDICWFVMTGEFFLRQELLAAYYREQLAVRLGNRFDPDQWQSMYEVGCLVDVLRKGPWHAFFAAYNDTEEGRAYMRRSIDSYNPLVRAGLKWL